MKISGAIMKSVDAEWRKNGGSRAASMMGIL